ncbi:MAG: 3-methyl-2-oxobutanoate hydroxymethyltransferase [Deltaproteobacteria bacterium]|jgi:3-methyl-2-oxobutanoate hydroxymethyltransferase|nr:3-methyl-2-oxobutanoate hydroxymethyltransferase [Deltaproteobacteria bacterium]
MSTEPKTAPKPQRRITTTQLAAMKTAGERITMVTAYDVLFARLADRAGVDAILVGDSLGMVVQGDENTLGVTVDDIIYHTRAVVRGAPRAHVVADMPFMSYQADAIEAIKNAGRLLKEGGAQSVKLEGGEELAPIVEKMVRAGIPVMGHVGLTPQSVHALGGFKVQGQDATNATRILRDAKALEAAGCFSIVLEGIPVELARVITRALTIPTIGIGAGVDCDGQVLVIYDLLGMYDERVPKFVKQYAQVGEAITTAVADFKQEVQAGTFPTEAHSYHAKEQLFRPREIVPAPQEIDDEDGIGGLYGVPV